MTISRGTLYAGVFLLAAGAVALANVAGMLEPAAVAGAVGALWPLAVIAVGVALLLRRSPAALVAGAVAAALPGLALAASVVAAPAAVHLPCSDPAAPAEQTRSHEGSFAGGAAVRLELDCGRLALATGPGTAWRVDTRGPRDRGTAVSADAGRLEVGSAAVVRGPGLGTGRVDWDVTLPTEPRLDLATVINAGRGQLALGGARLGNVDLEVNAGELGVDLAGASLERLDLGVNAGQAMVSLPAAEFSGAVEANAGSVQLCTPDGLGLRVTSSASLGSVQLGGLIKHDGAWETPGYATAPFKAELVIDASLGTVAINPQGGCR